MRKKLNPKLTTNEFNLLCDLYNGIGFYNLKHVNWRQDLFSYDEVFELKLKWKVNPKNLIKKLDALSSLEVLELLLEIHKFWKSDDSSYNLMGSVSPREKINEILSCIDRDKVVRSLETESIDNFYRICQELDMDYIIYSQDTNGYQKEVWGIAREHLYNFLISLSNEHQFSNVQKLSDAILNGFRA